MVDSSENILVEFDYNNIAVIDPNKVIDENGRAKERLVKHENLVMYANLECKVLPRTKLLVGASNADNLRTIAVTDMNFLNPGKKTYLDTKWTDEITGKDTIEGKGVNQRKLSKDKLVDTNKSEKWFYSQSTTSNKEPQAVDNGTLGIKSIQIKYGTEFLPQVTIRLEDVKGRTLFEAGNDSPYAAFFNLPYPLFYLTVKGFYGKAMRLPLMLQDFNCSYNPQTSNFDIDLTFLTYKFTVLSEVKFAHLLAVPHMYTSDIEVSPSTSSNSDKSDKKQGQVTLGFQKIKEVFTEYKAKGLIDKNFPDMTVYQLKTRLDTFIQTVLDSFIKQNIDPITNVLKYIDDVNTYRGEVYYYGGVDSWFKKYCDPNNFFILKRNKQKIYPLLIQESDTQAKIDSADSDLKARIDKWNEILKKNKTLGQNGGYKINNIEVKCEVLPNVVFGDFVVKKEDIDNSNIADGDIDYVETFKAYSGNTTPADSDKTEIKNKFTTILQSRGSKFYVFEGKESFVEKTNKLIKDAETKKDEITTALSQAVSDLLKDKNNSLGFVPTIRNVMAVIYASAEAFLRLQEEVHTKAWEKRNSAFRKAAIFNVQTAAANKDAVNTTVTDAINDALKKNVNVPVYPWPTFLIETSGENGQEKFQPKYPADNDVIQQTRADQWDEWPEVEFVEEYVKGLKFRLSEPTDYESSNEVYDSRRLSTNPIEFPPNNEIYSNQEETKYFYEIYERLLLASFYTKLNRSTNDNLQVAKISKVLGDVEKTNIIESLVGSSPFLQNKLLTLNITGQNYENLLLSFSNDGVGQSWQNFLRGIFNTSYINNYINTNQFNLFYQGSNPTEILGLTVNGSNVSTQVSFASEPDINEYITQSSTNKKFDFTDLYPFTEASWCNKNLPGNNPSNPNSLNFVSFSSGNAKAEDFYDTRKTLNFNPIFKTITNFKEDGSFSKPIVNYNYSIVPTNENDPLNTINQINNINNLENFYNSRSVNYSKQFPTEGNVNYSSKPGLLTPKQTTSILNTPFFINSMQESVQKFRNFDPYPFTVPAYLFLNSLPLSTLREKFSDYTVSTPQNSTQPIESVTYSDFIYPSLKKFAAIHKLPFVWILKIGSIWHRYKKWIDTGVDMLDSSWKSFDYISNFDPITSAKTTDYALTLSGNQNVDIILEKETLIGNETYTQISTGFYPQLINDFNVILQGYRLFSGYTNTDVQEAVTSGLTILNSPESNYTMGFSGDPSNNKRLIQINSWSVVSKSFDGQSWYLLPSHGALVNQVVSECFKDNKKVIEVSGNTSMYDGSVRTFWNCPNYGYFDLKKLVKPKPDEYMKKVFAGFVQQENFSLNGKSNFNTLNSEIFTLFSKEQLDYFEEKFLDYSRDKYSYIEKNENANRQQQNFSNFHRFFISMMRIDPSRLPPVINDTELIFYLQQQQLDTITNQIRGLMDYNIFLRLGNPSNFNRPVFYSFSNRILPSTFVPERYVATTNNALPNGTNGQTIANSLLQYPNEWKTLYKYVGYSEIPGISYTDTGSTIFDFFFDFDVAFNSLNIEKFSTIIKMYATQKKLKPNYNQVQFSLQMDEYINNSLGLLQKSINDIFPKLKNELAVVTVSKERQIEKTVDGEQTKLELWEVFKATNDKWIAGTDFKNKTLYEDVLFLDRASRDLGQKVVVDIYKLSATIDPEKNPLTMDTLDLVSTMCSESKFQSMFIPAYINFYGINEVSANAKPKPEGSLELANTLFGNFTNVDYRESSTKMVNFYAGPPSVQLDTQGVIDGFKNDSFDLRRVADNPLIENQIDKKDHATSNKVVGFNVDIGPQNQGIFKSFRVSQKNSTPTAESLEVISQMASQAGNRGFSTQSLSLYNLYKIRSYTCEIDMMGNALMQPLMYFNLRYVPMFTGPYLITNVDHTIDSTGNFNTKITGIRQPIASYDIQVDLLQSIKTNLVEQVVKEKVEELKNQKKSGSQNVLNKSSELVKKSVGDTDWNNTMQCTAETTYRGTYVKKEPKKSGKLSGKDLKQIIEQRLTTLNYTGKAFEKLKYALYSKIYIEFNKVVGGGIQAFENNFTGIDLLQNWYSKKKYLEKSFFCVTRGTSNDNTPIPYAVFKDVQANIDFTIDLWGTLQRKVDDSIPNEDLAILITTNNYDESTWNSLDAASKKTITDIILEARNDYNSIVI